MRIQMNDGRVLEGTPVQIVGEMQYLAFGQEGKTLAEYIDWTVAQLERFTGVKLAVEGASDEEKAASLVRGMLEGGLATQLKK